MALPLKPGFFLGDKTALDIRLVPPVTNDGSCSAASLTPAWRGLGKTSPFLALLSLCTTECGVFCQTRLLVLVMRVSRASCDG
jgi:hypothetical protein